MYFYFWFFDIISIITKIRCTTCSVWFCHKMFDDLEIWVNAKILAGRLDKIRYVNVISPKVLNAQQFSGTDQNLIKSEEISENYQLMFWLNSKWLPHFFALFFNEIILNYPNWFDLGMTSRKFKFIWFVFRISKQWLPLFRRPKFKPNVKIISILEKFGEKQRKPH